MANKEIKYDTNISSALDRFLRPERFETEPGIHGADTEYLHWRRTFVNFLSTGTVDQVPDSTKLKLLINLLSPAVYSHIRDCFSYDSAKKILNQIYIKPKNEVYARYCLATRKQKPEESIIDYVRALKQLAYECNFQSTIAEQNKNDHIRDALVSGILNQRIRQRLLENLTLTLDEAQNQAIALETAEKNSIAYTSSSINNYSAQLHAVNNTDTEIKIKDE